MYQNNKKNKHNLTAVFKAAITNNKRPWLKNAISTCKLACLPVLAPVLAPLLAITSNNALAAKSNEPVITICTGHQTSQSWMNHVSSYMSEGFIDTQLKVELWHAPTARAERLFSMKKCDGYFASSEDLPDLINRYDIIKVPVPMLKANIDLYRDDSYQCSEPLSCLAQLSADEQVGVFASKPLVDYLRQLTNANIVALSNVTQGAKMLKKQRLQMLVVPQVQTTEPVHELTALAKVGALREDIELFLWLDDKYQRYLNHLTLSFSKLELQPQHHSIVY